MKVEVNRNDEMPKAGDLVIDGDWYRVYVPSVVLGWPGILELAETEEELLDYLKDVSEFTRDEKGNN
jgi:hypothetical protein